MIEGLEGILERSGLPGVSELRELLQELLGARDGALRLVGQDELQPRGRRVFRLRFAGDGGTRSVIIKRLKPEIARRNELVAQRWLPAVRLSESGPPVLGSVAARRGDCVWHVYDDLGRWELDPHKPDRERVLAAIELIAQIHTRFASHHLLGEVRLHGGDLGIHFYEANMRDAISALEPWRPSAAEHQQLRDRLLERLHKLRDESPARTQTLAEFGGPETLLHGDLWAINIFVIPTTSGLRARLIDWDHAAVGPSSYDLSTLLLRFPAADRSWVFDLYQEAVARADWQLPEPEALNLLFETHEYARFANRIIWPAIALVQDRAEWGVEALAEIEQWFAEFGPVLPAGTPRLAAA
ncbi:MAG TPA: phosphotransferase [Verrucomicrobiae bacterium]|nr:phosphotransferase [Verrucomicrobiae bacterium]